MLVTLLIAIVAGVSAAKYVVHMQDKEDIEPQVCDDRSYGWYDHPVTHSSCFDTPEVDVSVFGE